METTTKYNRLIVILSVAIPLVVAALFGIKVDIELPVFLPPIYAGTNAITSVILIIAFWAIRMKNIELHKRLMVTAIVLSVLFLVMYVLYHMTSDSTPFGGKGFIKYLYYYPCKIIENISSGFFEKHYGNSWHLHVYVK